MAQTAFFFPDAFDGELESIGLDTAPATEDSPGVQSIVNEGAATISGRFEIGTSNKWLDVDEGAGEVSVKITVGAYLTKTALAAAIEADMNFTAGSKKGLPSCAA